MILSIQRDYKDTCTPGRLHIDGTVFATMERARDGDHPCIPEGTYQLVPHVSPKHGDVYSFVGGVCYENEVPQGEEGRCLILLHSANTASELLGCVAPGLSPGYIGQERAVLHSKAAMSAIREMLGREESHSIVISRAA
jgi:hypothetical protein